MSDMAMVIGRNTTDLHLCLVALGYEIFFFTRKRIKYLQNPSSAIAASRILSILLNSVASMSINKHHSPCFNTLSTSGKSKTRRTSCLYIQAVHIDIERSTKLKPHFPYKACQPGLLSHNRSINITYLPTMCGKFIPYSTQ